MLRPALKCALLVLVALAGGSRFVEHDRLYVNGVESILNDQVGYISVARNFAANGSLDSNVVYPSTLAQDYRRNSLYMPGHYWALAASFRLFGDTVWHSFLPSLAGYAASALLVFFIAARLYDPDTAVLACALFLFFPFNLMFAFTAMAEMDLTAAVLGAFALFLLLPARRRLWAGPMLLVLPLLFRETGAALAVPMAAIIGLAEEGSRRKTAVFAALTAAVVVAVMLSPAARGRPSLWGANILFRGRTAAIYQDAYAVARAAPRPADWAAAVARNAAGNARDLLAPPPRPLGPRIPEIAHLLFLLSGIPLGLFLWRRRKDSFALGVAAMLLLLLTADLVFYVVWTYRAVKSLLICEPFVAILWASAAAPAFVGRRRAWADGTVVVAALAGILAMSVQFRREKIVNDRTAEDTAFVESAADPQRGVLVAPWWLSLDYVYKHPSARWAFIPEGEDTWRALDRRYGVGTALLPGWGEESRETAAQAVGLGLTYAGRSVYRGLPFVLYRRSTGAVAARRRPASK